MSAAQITAIVFTVALLVTNTYFLLGSVPLLVLRHDTPMDSRFVRGFFHTYYRILVVTATMTALSYVFAGLPVMAAGAAAIAVLAVVLHRKVLSRMDSLRERMPAGGPETIAGFRRLHVVAILVNLLQLVLVVSSLVVVSLQLKR